MKRKQGAFSHRPFTTAAFNMLQKRLKATTDFLRRGVVRGCGKQECARRVRQLERGIIKLN